MYQLYCILYVDIKNYHCFHRCTTFFFNLGKLQHGVLMEHILNDVRDTEQFKANNPKIAAS